jgi:hypothetical protein
MATEAMAKDMSGWSDKTVCRLLTGEPDNAEFLAEAQQRELKCDSNAKSGGTKQQVGGKLIPKKLSSDGYICEPRLTDTYTSNGRKIEHSFQYTPTSVMKDYTTYSVLFGDRWEMPQGLNPCPNDRTLNFYYERWLNEIKNNSYMSSISVTKPSPKPREFENLDKNNEFLNKQLQHNGVLSYLYYSNGKIIYDGLAPQSRFDFKLDDNTELRSNSIGKSIVSYLIGNAICDGYIESVDETLVSWPVVRDTLYSSLTLLEILNMRARDQHVVSESDGFIKTGRWFNPVSIKSAASNELKGTKPNKSKKYNYNGFATNVAMNFMMFKVGDDWDSFLNKVFQERIKIQNRFIFQKVIAVDKTDGTGWYSAYASRYDYLRIAVAMMEDWQNDTCVGKYLKEMNDKKMPKSKMEWGFDSNPKNNRQLHFFSSHYGGQFHINYKGMAKRNIIGMDGYGGQSILIDMDNSRVVVVNSASTNYDWYELVYQPIKTGELREQ